MKAKKTSTKKECCFTKYKCWYDSLLRKAKPTDIFFVKMSSLFFGILLVYWVPAILRVNVWVWFLLFLISCLLAMRLIWRK
ncbi:MAG: hypothetical protein QXU20_03595 [Candidatus Woesearchaeota archaeon]